MALENKEVIVKKNWGLPFGIISFVVALLSLAPGYLAIVPLLGLAFAVITMISSGVAIVFGIVGIIGSRRKWPAIVGVVLGTLLLIWGIVRLFFVQYDINFTSSSEVVASTLLYLL